MSYFDELRDSFSNESENTIQDKGIDYVMASTETFESSPVAPTKEPVRHINRNRIEGGFVDSAISSERSAGTVKRSWWK